MAILLTAFGATFAFPSEGPSPWERQTLAIFVLVALLANRIVAGRKRAESALRASEAQLRATWEHAALGTALLNRRYEIERINPALERMSPSCSGHALAEGRSTRGGHGGLDEAFIDVPVRVVAIGAVMGIAEIVLPPILPNLRG